MMKIESKHIGQTVKTLVVSGTSDHAEAASFAMTAVGETPDRLMDWDTDQYDDGNITVRLYTH